MHLADDTPVTSRRKPGVDQALRWLIGIVVLCLGLVLGLKLFFADLQAELNESSANERARLFVGEELVQGIGAIEKDIYLMAVTTNAAGYGRVYKRIDSSLDKVMHDLNVLKFGGTTRREVRLNIEGVDAVAREVTYRPAADAAATVLELIEIGPLLGQVREQTERLESLLAARWKAIEKDDRKAFYNAEEAITLFLKFLPPYFERVEENANRLFYDSSERLREIEGRLQQQRDRLRVVELGLVALVLILSGLATALFVRRINDSNRQLAETLEAMRTARDEAERASRAKTEFVSRMSHELRTPLNAIIGFAELLKDEALEPTQIEYVDLINGSGKHLMGLINQVLDHAKIEAGELRLERIAFDLPAEIDAVVAIVTERTAAKGLEFVAAVPDNLPPRIEGDPTRLRQVLINLLANAVKFTETGSVELRVASEDGRLHFSIRDTGIGMDRAALDRLFKPFSQADDSVTRKYGGTGLGLIIARDIIEAMGGAIEVESAPGAGTCFWFSIPLHAAAADALPAKSADSIEAAAGALAERIHGPVLLVDDNRVNQQLGAAMLGRLGLRAEVADNGADCLARLAGGEYAVVLMDMEMPGMDGITATKRIREAEAGTRHLPIVAMTANALAEDRQRCLDAGMDGFIAKPISLAALRAELARLFGGSPPPAPAAPAVTERVGDRKAAIALMGDAGIYREVAAMFITDAPNQVAELDAALAAADWPRLVRVAHTLKGLLATFAAPQGEGAARALEAAARAGDPDGTAGDLAAAVREQVERLRRELAAER